MPWSQTSPMDQRTQFIADYLRESLNITELCDLYGVSRKTGYKWIDRYLRVSKNAREDPGIRPMRPHPRSSRRSSKHVAGIRPGAARSSSRLCTSATPVGIYRAAPRSAIS